MDFTSRVNNFLDKHHRWGNAAAVLSIQMLTLLICLGTADRDAGVAFITAGVTTTSLYYRYRNPYGSIYVFTVALLLSLFAPTCRCYWPRTIPAGIGTKRDEHAHLLAGGLSHSWWESVVL